MNKFSDQLKNKFAHEKIYSLPKQRGGHFNAELTPSGIKVDCLGSAPLLEWGAFDAVQNLLLKSATNSAIRGSAMNSKLGDSKLPIDSVEGCIAVYYKTKLGQSTLRRVSPVANILVWAGLCKHTRGALTML